MPSPSVSSPLATTAAPPRAAVRTLRLDPPLALVVAAWALSAASAPWTGWSSGGVVGYGRRYATVAVAWGAARLLASTWRHRRASRPLLTAWHAEGGAARLASAAAAVGLFALLSATYTGWKVALPALVPFAGDAWLVRADAALGVPAFTAAIVDALSGPHGAAVHAGLVAVYYPGCASVALVSLVALAWAPPSPARTRLLVVTVVAVLGLGVIVAAASMAVGPIFLEALAPTLAPTAAPLVDALGRSGGGMLALRDALLAAHATASTNAGAGISAFPSLHVAGVTLAALTAHGLRWPRAVRWGTAALVPVTMAASVAVGMHYAVDGLAAIAGVALVWWSAGVCTAMRTEAPSASAAAATASASPGES